MVAMIIGAHTVRYSADPDKDKALLRDVIGLPNVDVGHGWLIFGLPPAEVAVHPSEKNDLHEFFLMCDDVEPFVAQMGEHNVPVEPVEDAGWGRLTKITLPGGGRPGVCPPRHERPPSMPGK